ncbi:MAG: LpxL/LpxP family acyltransferase [Gammaproteobacteria bacterium]
MVSPTQPTRLRSEVIRSPALYLKELEVIEDVGSRGSHLLSGTRLKSIIIPFLFWLLRHMPLFVALLPVRLLIGMMRMLYGWRNNPLSQSCEYICVLAQRAGYEHQPRQVYQQYLSNARGVIENYFRLYRQGVEAVIDRVAFAPEQTEMLNQLLAEYGGVVVAVPHNFGSAFSALKMHREFPLILIARNPSTIARTKAALGMFERMQVSILMVRGGNPFELSRTLFSILKSGKVLAATLDNVDRSEQGVVAQFFGQQVGFPSWAAKMTARLGVPVVPSYFHSQGKQITGVLGEPLVSNELEMVAQHYVSFFEKKMLEDPASWAYLGDKRWRRVLREASEAAIAEK